MTKRFSVGKSSYSIDENSSNYLITLDTDIFVLQILDRTRFLVYCPNNDTKYVGNLIVSLSRDNELLLKIDEYESLPPRIIYWIKQCLIDSKVIGTNIEVNLLND